MKTMIAISRLAGIFLVCVIGCAAALAGCDRVDRWCARQLTDGQSEEDAL